MDQKIRIHALQNDLKQWNQLHFLTTAGSPVSCDPEAGKTLVLPYRQFCKYISSFIPNGFSPKNSLPSLITQIYRKNLVTSILQVFLLTAMQLFAVSMKVNFSRENLRCEHHMRGSSKVQRASSGQLCVPLLVPKFHFFSQNPQSLPGHILCCHLLHTNEKKSKTVLVCMFLYTFTNIYRHVASHNMQVTFQIVCLHYTEIIHGIPLLKLLHKQDLCGLNIYFWPCIVTGSFVQSKQAYHAQ